MKARTACINELRNLLITAPEKLRERAGTSAEALTTLGARLRTAADVTDPIQGHQARFAGPGPPLPSPDHRDQKSGQPPQSSHHPGPSGPADHTRPQTPDRRSTTDHPPATTPTSSPPRPPSPPCAEPPRSRPPGGKTNRHRLWRGGDRQANRALYLSALARMATNPRPPHPPHHRGQNQKKRSPAASTATSPASYPKPSPATKPLATITKQPLDNHRSIPGAATPIPLSRPGPG